MTLAAPTELLLAAALGGAPMDLAGHWLGTFAVYLTTGAGLGAPR